MNEEGERLLNFCAANKLSVMNTMYKQKLQRLITWVSPDGRTKNQIDYILVPADLKSCIKSCSVFNSADVNSDHSLLMAKYRLELPQRKNFKKPPKRYDVSKLKTAEYAEEFKVKIGGYFETLINEINDSPIESSYNKFVETVNKATEEVVGLRKRKTVDGLSKKTIELCERRRKLRKDILSSPHCGNKKENYREVNRLVKKEVRKAKREKLERLLTKLEDDFQKKNSHSLFKTVRELEGKPRKNVSAMKGADGKKTTNPAEVLEIWRKHFESHLNTEFPRDEQALNELGNDLPAHTDDEFSISKNDITKAIAALKNKIRCSLLISTISNLIARFLLSKSISKNNSVLK